MTSWMTTVTNLLSDPQLEFLIDAGIKFFRDNLGINNFNRGEPYRADFEWLPHFWFRESRSPATLVEASKDKILPVIAKASYGDILQIDEPICVYIICTEAVFNNASQKDVKAMSAKGYGLISIDANGDSHIRNRAVPLLQIISPEEIKNRVKACTASNRKKVLAAFEEYKTNPKNGVQEMTEIFEAFVQKAVVDAVRKNWLDNDDLTISKANQLIKMQNDGHFHNVSAVIGEAQSFMRNVRNIAKHPPKSRTKAAERARDYQSNFIAGIRAINNFSAAMKSIGLTGRQN